MSHDRCKNHTSVSDEGLAERQRALTAMLKLLDDNKICLACGCSAALYVASIAAGPLDIPLDEFLDLAKKIYNNSSEQRNAAGKVPDAAESSGLN